MASELAAWHRLFPSLHRCAYCNQTRGLPRCACSPPVLSGSLSDHRHESPNFQHADGQQATVYVVRVITTVVPRTHSRSSGADSGVYASTRTCTPSPTSCSPTQCTGSSESNSARTFHAPSTRSRTYTLEAPASLIPVENTIVGPSYWVFSTDSLLMQSRPSDGGIILATMTSLLHGLSSQTPTIPSPGHRNTP